MKIAIVIILFILSNILTFMLAAILSYSKYYDEIDRLERENDKLKEKKDVRRKDK